MTWFICPPNFVPNFFNRSHSLQFFFLFTLLTWGMFWAIRPNKINFIQPRFYCPYSYIQLKLFFNLTNCCLCVCLYQGLRSSHKIVTRSRASQYSLWALPVLSSFLTIFPTISILTSNLFANSDNFKRFF